MTTPGYDTGAGYPGAPQAQFQPDRDPVTFDVAYPENLSRGLIFIKWLLAIPHYIILYVLEIVSWVLTVVAWFAILFTGRYPRGMFDFNVGVQRWQARVFAYVYLMTDKYPPFSFEK